MAAAAEEEGAGGAGGPEGVVEHEPGRAEGGARLVEPGGPGAPGRREDERRPSAGRGGPGADGDADRRGGGGGAAQAARAALAAAQALAGEYGAAHRQGLQGLRDLGAGRGRVALAADLPGRQAAAPAPPVAEALADLPEAVRARVAAFVAAGACHEDGDAAAAGQVVAGLNALLAFRGAAGPLVGRLDRAFEALRAALFRCLEAGPAGPAGPADLASLQETQVLASVVQEMVGQDWREAALMCEDCLENTLGAPLDTYLLFWELRPAIDEALLQRFEGLPPPPAP